jgi:hypothetical protein
MNVTMMRRWQAIIESEELSHSWSIFLTAIVSSGDALLEAGRIRSTTDPDRTLAQPQYRWTDAVSMNMNSDEQLAFAEEGGMRRADYYAET